MPHYSYGGRSGFGAERRARLVAERAEDNFVLDRAASEIRNASARRMIGEVLASPNYVPAPDDFWKHTLAWLEGGATRTLRSRGAAALVALLRGLRSSTAVKHGSSWDESRCRVRTGRPDWMSDASLLPKAPPGRRATPDE